MVGVVAHEMTLHDTEEEDTWESNRVTLYTH